MGHGIGRVGRLGAAALRSLRRVNMAIGVLNVAVAVADRSAVFLVLGSAIAVAGVGVSAFGLRRLGRHQASTSTPSGGHKPVPGHVPGHRIRLTDADCGPEVSCTGAEETYSSAEDGGVPPSTTTMSR